MTAPLDNSSFKPTNLEITGWLQAIAGQQDRASFEKLYHYIAPKLKSYMIKQGADADTADDLAQEAMVKVWHKAGQYNPDRSAPATWIYRIARNLQIDQLRKRKFYEVEFSTEADREDEGVSGHERSAVQLDANKLHGLMNNLSDEQMNVIRLAFFEGLSQSEICKKLDIPLGTVKSRMRQSFSKLRVAMGDNR
jgi:RNA polymerase sigma-70 factor (ECF subfamily)